MFARILLRLMLIGISLFSFVACQPASVELGQEASIEGGSYRVVSVQELESMLETKDFTMVNVHIPWQGDIPQTDLRLAYDQIEQKVDQLPTEKDSKILVYCLTSGMAKKAVQSLIHLGYSEVWMLEGGTTAWEKAGLSINK